MPNPVNRFITTRRAALPSLTALAVPAAAGPQAAADEALIRAASEAIEAIADLDRADAGQLTDDETDAAVDRLWAAVQRVEAAAAPTTLAGLVRLAELVHVQIPHECGVILRMSWQEQARPRDRIAVKLAEAVATLVGSGRA